MGKLLYEELSYAIVGAAMEVHRTLGSGFLEKIYQRALAYELGLRGVPFEEQVPLQVFYKGQLIGEYYADFIVDGKIVVEIKAVSALNDVHIAQALHYLAATKSKVGLLVNFGSQSLEYRRLVL